MNQNVMNLSDAIIIYLSCGAPFAVHVLVTRQSGDILITAVRTIYSFVTWPISAGRFFYRFLDANIKPTADDVTNGSVAQIDNLLLELESLSNRDRTTSSCFEFREAIEQYTGLAAASIEIDHHSEAADIFNVSDHPSPEIATACLSRSTRRRLEQHLNRARSEFLSQVMARAAAGRDPSRIGSIAVGIAEAVNDKEAAFKLRRTFRPLTAQASRSAMDEKDQLWSTEQSSPVVS